MSERERGRNSEALVVGGIDIVAVSVAGLETCIEIPDWGLCFDIGRCPPTAVKRRRVCFTHAHIDHMGGVALHLGQRDLLGMPPPIYHVPEQVAEPFAALLDVWRRLDRSELPATVEPVSAGSTVDLGNNRRIFVFQSYHRVPTLGYALERTTRPLLPELVGRPGFEIAERRARGEPILGPQTPSIELAFCGDTRIEVVEREPLVRKARVLVLECTFVGQVPVERAQRTGHIHLDEIVSRADLFENEAILLTHFSARHSRSEILRALDKKLPRELRERVTPLLGDRE